MLATDLLTQVDRVRAMLGQSLTSPPATTTDFFLQMLIVQVSAEITASCNRTHWLISNAVNPITQTYMGQGGNELVLNQWPIQTPILAGNTVQGSATIAGLPSTAGLFVGQGVTGLALNPALNQPVSSAPAPLAIASVDSATQVTLNGTATLTATQTPIGFGVQVHENWTAYGTPGQFQSQNLLAEGGDYWIRRDQPGGQSKCAILNRIGGPWLAGWSFGGGGYWWGSGPDLACVQQPGPGNYQVKATYGFESIPYNLELAAIWTVNKARWMRTVPLLFQSESDDGYSYSLGLMKQDVKEAVQLGILDGAIAGILSKFRINAFSSG